MPLPDKTKPTVSPLYTLWWAINVSFLQLVATSSRASNVYMYNHVIKFCAPLYNTHTTSNYRTWLQDNVHVTMCMRWATAVCSALMYLLPYRLWVCLQGHYVLAKSSVPGMRDHMTSKVPLPTPKQRQNHLTTDLQLTLTLIYCVCTCVWVCVYLRCIGENIILLKVAS